MSIVCGPDDIGWPEIRGRFFGCALDEDLNHLIVHYRILTIGFAMRVMRESLPGGPGDVGRGGGRGGTIAALQNTRVATPPPGWFQRLTYHVFNYCLRYY